MKILVLDGIGASGKRNSNVINPTVDRLVADLKASAIWINWPSAMFGVGGKGSWEHNARIGVDMIVEEMNRDDDDVILLAYSGGNRVVHEFLDRSPHLIDRVLAVGFMSDPWRPRDKWQHGVAKPIGYGVMGEDETPIPDRCFWTSGYDDVISAARPDALMRYAADMSGGEPDKIIHDVIIAAQHNRFQLSFMLGLPPLQWFAGLGPRLAQLTDDAHGYLTGAHTRAYTDPYKGGDSLAIRLGASISWKVRKDKGLV